MPELSHNSTALPLLPLVLADAPLALREALAQEGVPACAWQANALQGKFVLFDSSRAACPRLLPGQRSIDLHVLRTASENDPFAALADESSARHAWKIGSWTVCEEVAHYDKRAVRQALMAELKRVVEQQGGVWLRIGAYPYPFRSAFNFRFDHDEYRPDDLASMLNSIAGWEHATSHYLCGSAYEPHPEALKRLVGLHIGGHGYRHHTYRDRIENRDNIRRGLEVLAAAGIDPRGFAAPHGRHYADLPAVLDELGMRHSSEFAFAYDDLPQWPRDSNVLQIPVHPVCLGLFLDAARSAPTGRSSSEAAEACAEHFVRVANEKYQAGEPVFLYGHPDGRLGRFPHVLRRVFAWVSDAGSLWCTTLEQFAHWWRTRRKIELTVHAAGDFYVVRAERLPVRQRVAIEYFRGSNVARMELRNEEIRFSPTALAFEGRRAAPSVQPVRIDAPHTLGDRLRAAIDWERVTPLDEIPRRTWRHCLKRTLRRFKPEHMPTSATL